MKQAVEDRERVFVCGAGHQGLTMAAHLALNGVRVSLWNRTGEHIKKILETKEIHCAGLINGVAKLSEVSTDIASVVSDYVMVTTPSSAHKDIAREIAPFIHPEMIIVLNPGRTFGAIEFAEELKKQGVKELPMIAETQTIVYTCRKSAEDSVCLYALKREVEIAALRGNDIYQVLSKMPQCLRPYFSPVSSVAITSLSNIGMVLHCAPVLMNVGWIECEKVDFKYYYDGISRTIARLLEKMDSERQAVAKGGGYCIESLKKWLERTYSVQGEDLFECLHKNEAYKEIDAPPTIDTRYLFEDVPNGLVPLESMGKELGIPTPIITTIIDLACYVKDVDYRLNGRNFTLEQLKNYF